MDRLAQAPVRIMNAQELKLAAAVARHPAGKALLVCPTCDGRGKVTKRAVEALILSIVGRIMPVKISG